MRMQGTITYAAVPCPSRLHFQPPASRKKCFSKNEARRGNGPPRATLTTSFLRAVPARTRVLSRIRPPDYWKNAGYDAPGPRRFAHGRVWEGTVPSAPRTYPQKAKVLSNIQGSPQWGRAGKSAEINSEMRRRSGMSQPYISCMLHRGNIPRKHIFCPSYDCCFVFAEPNYYVAYLKRT